MRISPFIIGLGHRRRVGKDTFGGMLIGELQERLGVMHIRKAAFADKLKDVCQQIYGWDGLKGREWYEENPEDREIPLPTIGLSPREIWIKFGTDAVRNNVYQDTWIDCLLRGAQADVLIVTDVRFPGEAKKIHGMGGVLIRIDNPRVEKSSDVADSAMESWTQWDRVIVNSGTVDDLATIAETVADSLVPRIRGLKVSEK